MKKLFIAAISALLLFPASAFADSCCQYADSVPANGLFNVIVISGAAPDAKLLAENNWVFPEFISQTDKADSEMNILYHYPDKIVTAMKSTVCKLASNVKTFIINGKVTDKAEYAKIPASFILSADFSGDTLAITTRKNVNEPSLLKPLTDESVKWFKAQINETRTGILSRTLSDVVLTDLATYGNQLVTVDDYIHTPAQAAELAKGKNYAIRVTGVGDLLTVTASPMVNVDTSDTTVRIVKLDAEAVSGKTIAQVIAQSGIPAVEVNDIICYPTHTLVVSYPEHPLN